MLLIQAFRKLLFVLSPCLVELITKVLHDFD